MCSSDLRAEEDEAPEAGVDDVAVDAHAAEARSDGDRLVRYDPNPPARKVIHLHREAHRRVQRPDALLFERRHRKHGGGGPGQRMHGGPT